MHPSRFAGAALAALLLSSCAAPAGAHAPDGVEPDRRPTDIRPNIYEVAPGQGRDAPARDTAGVLEVSGSAEVRVEADRARVSFAVETEDSTARGASGENARRMSRVHGVLEALDAPGLTLETFGYRLQPSYGRPDPERGGSRRIEGYRATNFIRVTVDDVDAVGRILDAAIGAGANRTTGLSFEATDTEEARLEALRMAVENARKEAEAIAGALGAALGPALDVRGGADRPGPMVRFRAEAAVPTPAPDTPVEAGEQTVSASVTIRYRLDPPPSRE